MKTASDFIENVARICSEQEDCSGPHEALETALYEASNMLVGTDEAKADFYARIAEVWNIYTPESLALVFVEKALEKAGLV